MTGYRLREMLLGMLGISLLASFLALRSCRQSTYLRAQRLDLEALSASVRHAYADGDPAQASADPRERLTKFQVAPGASPGNPPRLLVDVNAAGVEELQRLDGIGPGRAADIVATRERLGGFKSLEDLLEVPGIGGATLAKFAQDISLGDGALVKGAPLAPPPQGEGSPGAVGNPGAESTPVRPPSLAAPAPTPRGETAPPAAPTPPAASSPSPANSTPLPSHTPPPSGQFGERSAPVNINLASVEELCRLSGIGEAKAADIVAYRKQNGPFRYPSDITKVKGIGEKTFLKNRHLIVVK
jgi:competence protein ComEA